MATEKLPLAQAAAAFEQIKPELGTANLKRLTLLQALCQKTSEADQLQIATVLQHLYPNNTSTQASTNLRKFRLAFNEAATEAGVKLEWKVDQDRKRGPERSCWFEGDKLRTRIARQHSWQQADTGDEQLEAPTGISLDSRQPVHFFICYARANQTWVNRFKEALEPRLKADKDYLFELWQDTDIILGTHWHTAIQTALEQCDFGLLLTSPEFFNSEYVVEEELPAFLLHSVNEQSCKPAIPVGLVQYNFSVTRMHGLEKQQVFRNNEKFFNQTQGNKKLDFAEALHHKIRQAIEHHGLPAATAASDDDEPRAPQPTLQPNHHASKYQQKFRPDCDYPEPLHGHRATVGETIIHDPAPDTNKKAINVLNDLHNWLNDENSEPFYALLGDLGMGKTTTLRTLTQKLLRDETSPTPLYFDLRDLHHRSTNATLESILRDLLDHSWGVRAGELSPQDIIDLVQKEGAIAIFDGLDEVLVNLPPQQGQQFIRLLWQVLPPRNPGKPETRGRMILSCRTHYFPSVHEQNSLFLGENREQIKSRDYRGTLLLPFNETQIKNYLRNNFPQNDADQSWQLIQAIHNLQDLATRPYTLSVIASQLKVLEQKQLRGKVIDATDLYEVIINDWLNRDEGKHQLNRHHKRQLMGMLAYDLWQSGQRTWPYQQLEQWLVDRLHQHPEIVRHYQLDNTDVSASKTLIALFKEDLRTATFIVRPNDDEFRFAHSSMLEYFLACQLYNLCANDETDASETAFALQPSQESWAFMAQIARRQGEAVLQQALRQIKQRYRPGISENALRYTLLAQSKNWPSVSLTHWQLPGAKLRQFEFIADHSNAGPTIGQNERLNLSGINLKDADLRQARFHHCRLDDSQFQSARLAQAEFLDCQADGADFSDADLTACTFRNHTGSTWKNSSFETNKLWRSRWLSEKPQQDWLDCRWPGAKWLRTACSPVHPAKPVPPARLEWLTCHSNIVTACAFSPDSQQILSASSDNTLKLWEQDSGECLQTFTGHSGSVTACAFSPDGKQLLSASDDNTLKLWDRTSGECLQTFTGHSGSVTACAFSPDGKQLLSASDDATLKLWDRDDGECLQTFTEHSSLVTACAFSPDGKQLLSASADNTLKLWGRDSGECLQTFTEHSSLVTACAFSPDGKQLLSASADNTLKLWDRDDGECLQTFTGHSGLVTACAFSPDGKQLLSASDDATLKLWDRDDGECLQTFTEHSGLVTACAFSPDGKQLLSASWDNTLKLWGRDSGECLQTFTGHSGSVTACAFSPDGKQLLSASADNTLKLWDRDDGECLQTFTEHSSLVTACAFSPDGKQLLSASADNTLKLWGRDSGECLQTFTGHSGSVTACAFSPDGKQLLSASEDDTLKLWDRDDGECLQTFTGHSGLVTACAFSPDGKQLLSASEDATLKLWDRDDGEGLQTFTDHSDWVTACAFSPDGKQLLSASWDGTLKLWDRDSGEGIQTFTGHSSTVTACAFSPDGKQLLSASQDNTLKLWDRDSGEGIQTFTRHSSTVTACAFSPDGKQLLSASEDGTLRQWHCHSGQMIQPVIRPSGKAWAVIDEEQNRVISCGPEAWRYLGWVGKDENGELRRYPAEINGWLPEVPD